jgi:hypothetical protein
MDRAGAGGQASARPSSETGTRKGVKQNTEADESSMLVESNHLPAKMRESRTGLPNGYAPGTAGHPFARGEKVCSMPRLAKGSGEVLRASNAVAKRSSGFTTPRSNKKIERWHKTLKGERIRVKTPLSLEDARRLVTEFVDHDNDVRLHGAIGYVAPADKLAGRDRAIIAERDRKLDAARQQRKAAREASRPAR